jgi:hypothetical protein
MELYTTYEGRKGRHFTPQKIMPLAKSDCFFSQMIAAKNYLTSTKEKELFIHRRDESMNQYIMLTMKPTDRQP